MISFLKKRILCVDDSEDDCVLFSLILTEEGYEVESAQSFTDAAQLIETSVFDLCSFDISLQDGTGFELLEKVRAIAPSMPIIICSGDARGSTQEQVMAAGAQAFFTKPIDYDLLVKTIAQIISSVEPNI